MGKKVVSIDEKREELQFNGTFTKINISDKGIPFIAYNAANSQCTKEIKAKGDKEPKDSFYSALNALKPFFADITEMEHKIDDTKIIGVSFDDTGIVVTGLIKLTKHDISAPMCVNTVHIFYENKAGGFEVPKDVKKLLNELKSEAIAYMNNDTKFKQQNMFKTK